MQCHCLPITAYASLNYFLISTSELKPPMLPMLQARANIDLLDAMANHDLRLSYFFREAKLGILTSVQVTLGLSLFGMACNHVI